MAKTLLPLEIEGLQETLKAVQTLEADLRKTTNRELRTAAGECARGLVGDLVAAASASGVPVAKRVASSIRVKSDRLPSVTIGGTRKVGSGGASAGALVWGSEHGPAGDVNHFGVDARPSGYWIAPTVERFAGGRALVAYRQAVHAILSRRKLV